MKNAEILIKSLTEWAEPVIEMAMQNSNNTALSFVKSFISPEWLSKSLMNHLGIPMLSKKIEKVPDELITPEFVSDLIDGMIDKRVENGRLEIPEIGIGLNPDSFKSLKEICESNFKKYTKKVVETA